MSLELVVLGLILVLVAYLVVRFHVTLAKFVPGKAGDFLDDFKMNGSNVDHAAIVQAAVGGAANVVAATHPPVQPATTVTIPGTDRQIDRGIASLLGVSERTSQILDDRVKNAPQAGDGWIPGSELGNGQNYRANTYVAGQPFPYTIHASGPFEFVWSECVGTPAGMADVTVSGPAGTFTGSSFLKLGSVKVPGAKAGESYTATLLASMSGPGHAQINPLKPV